MMNTREIVKIKRGLDRESEFTGWFNQSGFSLSLDLEEQTPMAMRGHEASEHIETYTRSKAEQPLGGGGLSTYLSA